MCKELCGQVFEDFRAGKISYKAFVDYHRERVLTVMREDAKNGKLSVIFLDYRDGSSEILTSKPKTEQPSID